MSKRSLFSARLREFALAKIKEPGDHSRTEIAKAYIAEESKLIAAYVESIVLQKVTDLLKDLFEEPADFGQLELFNGLPTAITIADGVVKSTDQCTLNDLGAGLEYRRLNIIRAQGKMRAYEHSMAAFAELREREDETLGEVAARLRNRTQAGEQAA